MKKFLTGFINKEGLLVTDRKKIGFHYVKSWPALLDLISVFPCDFIARTRLSFEIFPWLRLNRVIRVYRLREFLDRTWRTSSYPTLCRLADNLLMLCILVHWCACLYYQASKMIGFSSDVWVINTTKFVDFNSQYLYCIYWASMHLARIGQVPEPDHLPEYFFTLFVVLFEFLYFAEIVGHIAAVTSEWSSKWLNNWIFIFFYFHSKNFNPNSLY